MDIWARLVSFEEYFDDEENRNMVPHLVIWSLFVAGTTIVLSVLSGDALVAAVPVGVVAGVVAFAVLGIGLYTWRTVNADTADGE